MASLRLLAVVPLVALLGAGCAKVITISPDGATVTANTGPVTFTATPPEATDAVTWSLTGLGSLDTTTGTTVAYTPPTHVPEATVTATLTATTGELSDTVTITINRPDPITVNGVAITSQGVRTAGAQVAIGTATAISDASGNFSIPNIIPPYDLVVYSAAGDGSAIVYVGLSRSDPKVLWLAGGGSLSSADVGGAISGGDSFPEPLTRTAVAFGSPDGEGTDTTLATPYALSVSWLGTTPTTTGTVHVLQWRPNSTSETPTQYRGYGSRPNVALVNSGTVSNQDVTLTVPSTASISGSVVAPAGYTIATKGLAVELPGPVSISLGSVNGATAGFNFLVPTGINSTNSVTAAAQNLSEGQGTTRLSGIAPGTAGVTVNIVRPAVQIAPADGTTGVTTSTDFSWNPIAGGVHLVQMSAAGAPTLLLITSATTGRIPDLSALGLTIPSSSSYQWQITSLAPFTGVDDFAGRRRLIEQTGTVQLAVTIGKSFSTQ